MDKTGKILSLVTSSPTSFDWFAFWPLTNIESFDGGFVLCVRGWCREEVLVGYAVPTELNLIWFVSTNISHLRR
jgi:hypothetical protein